MNSTVVLYKNWKIYWFKKIYCLGPEDQCSSWGPIYTSCNKNVHHSKTYQDFANWIIFPTRMVEHAKHYYLVTVLSNGTDLLVLMAGCVVCCRTDQGMLSEPACWYLMGFLTDCWNWGIMTSNDSTWTSLDLNFEQHLKKKKKTAMRNVYRVNMSFCVKNEQIKDIIRKLLILIKTSIYCEHSSLRYTPRSPHLSNLFP
jgi:hypothetical protein